MAWFQPTTKKKSFQSVIVCGSKSSFNDNLSRSEHRKHLKVCILRSIKIPTTHWHKLRAFFPLLWCFFLNRQLSLGISSVMYINDFINIVPFDVVFLIDGIMWTGKKIQSFFIIENKVSKPKSRNNCYSKRCFQRQRFEYELTKFDTLITF